jgi:hypothetical protein
MERQAGKKYLIASTQERDFRSMVVSPDFIFEIGDHEDLPGDVELILKCRALSIAEQVHAIAAAIMSGTESRSFFLAAYIDVLWKFESDIDIETLSQALKSAAGGALSDDAKYFVLSGLAPAHHMPNDAQKRLWSLFVTLTARYLVEEETKTGVAPGVRSVIADEFVPAILGTSSGQAELRAALEALMVFPKWRLTDAEKARARNWMAILQAR